MTTDTLILLANIFNEMINSTDKIHIDKNALHTLELRVRAEASKYRKGWRVMPANLEMTFTEQEKEIILNSVDIVCNFFVENEFHARTGFSKVEARTLVALFK